MITFSDGDRRNFQLDNLICLPRRDRCRNKPLPVGTEKAAKHGHVIVKVADPDHWKLKHHLIWEAANGPLPSGYTIRFADGNHQNFSLDNLVTVSKKDLGTALARPRSRPVGFERVKDGYILVKVAEPNEWRLKHILIWEAAHGALPEGHKIVFADGDRRNYSIDNLIMTQACSPPVKYPVGTERQKKGGYVEIKVANPDKWCFKHHLLWEEAYGTIPPGYAIRFADGNHLNLSLDNLVKFSKKDMVKALAKARLRPVGFERDTAGYIMVKVAEPNKWRLKHVLIWETAHGPLPEGHKIVFADGDRRNYSIDNLILTPACSPPVKHPVGTERQKRRGYVLVKVANPDKWRLKHHLIWEEAHGPIPPGHFICFADGNSRNLSLDNLILMSKAEHAILSRKRIPRLDIDFTKSALVLVRLKRKIRFRQKQ